MIKSNDQIKVYGRMDPDSSEFEETIYEGEASKIDLDIKFPVKSQKIEQLLMNNAGYADCLACKANDKENLGELLNRIK